MLNSIMRVRYVYDLYCVEMRFHSWSSRDEDEFSQCDRYELSDFSNVDPNLIGWIHAINTLPLQDPSQDASIDA